MWLEYSNGRSCLNFASNLLYLSAGSILSNNAPILSEVSPPKNFLYCSGLIDACKAERVRLPLPLSLNFPPGKYLAKITGTFFATSRRVAYFLMFSPFRLAVLRPSSHFANRLSSILHTAHLENDNNASYR